MITVCDKGKCTGCMECLDVCSKEAIQIVDEGIEYNAIVDSNKCIKCNACHKACQNNRKLTLNKPIYWSQGWAGDNSIRMESSSGGIAAAVERAFIKSGGVVCSCTFRAGKFEFDFAETESEVSKFAGSKYVKSNPQGIYIKILEKLKAGRRVLFVGLPCQVSAAKHYTKNHQNLYTIDLICHGTPSPKILESFLKEYNIRLTELESIRFREKDDFMLEENGRRFAVPTIMDSYMMTFLKSTSYTENCYQCNYAQLNRVGDITLGDSWGSNLEKQIQDKGISLLLCQSEKGKELIKQTDLVLMDVDLKKAVENNHQLEYPSLKPQQRMTFFRELRKGHGFKRAVRKCYPKVYLKNTVKTLLYKTKCAGGGKPLSSNNYYVCKWEHKIIVLSAGNIYALLGCEKCFVYPMKTDGMFAQSIVYSIVEYFLWQTIYHSLITKYVALYNLKFVNSECRILSTC